MLHRLKMSPLAFGVLLTAALLVGGPDAGCFAQDPGADDPPTTEAADIADGPTDAAVENVGADAESAEAGETDGPTGWQKRIDTFFGKYVVAPVGYVIFWGPTIEPEPTESNRDPDDVKIPIVVLVLLGAGLFFTLRMAFINFRGFWHAIRLTKGDYDDPRDAGEVSHFQALSAALSATVGLGNIGGVAIAVSLGGPGATFWMILVGLLGMSTKFAECTLAQIYRTVDDRGHVLGGPMRYLRSGLSELGLRPLGSVLAFLFAILCVGASLGGGNSYQINQSLDAIRSGFPIVDEYPWAYGVIMAILVGMVIIGGIRSIGRVAGTIVPVMCVAYVLAAFYILITNIENVPAAFASIFTSAFSFEAGFGGFIGVAITGTQRAVFSNEAGVGSAPIAHSAAKTNEPVSEGIVALLEPFIDTVLVCTTTSLVILVSGVPIGGDIEGASLTLEAFQTGGAEWFGYVLYAAVVLFALSTCISWSYYGERCFVQLFGTASSPIYKTLFVVFTFLGSVITATKVLEFSDLMIFGMAIPNLIGVFLLSGVVKRRLNEYWSRYRSGELDREVAALQAGETEPDR